MSLTSSGHGVGEQFVEVFPSFVVFKKSSQIEA
jgi:hypothetical protein